MAETYAQMEERAISNANAVTATEALNLLESDPDALLVDVRDESEVEATGLGLCAITAPGRGAKYQSLSNFILLGLFFGSKRGHCEHSEAIPGPSTKHRKIAASLALL